MIGVFQVLFPIAALRLVATLKRIVDRADTELLAATAS
jgi:hypothetical protein